jgi:rubrerythrin
MITGKNLDEGFARDSQAYLKFLAFAAKAEAEGHTMPAKLFRAAAGQAEKFILMPTWKQYRWRNQQRIT